MRATARVRVEHDNIDPVKKATSDSINSALEMTGIAGYIGGTLRNSIAHQVVADENAVYVGTNVEYAPYVELGTSKMAKRPYLKPAIEDHIEYYKQIISDELGRL